MNPKEVDIVTLKQKIIKTDEVFKLYTNNNEQLEKAKKVCKNLNQKLAETTHELNSLKLKTKNSKNLLDDGYIKLREDYKQLQIDYSKLERESHQSINKLLMQIQTINQEFLNYKIDVEANKNKKKCPLEEALADGGQILENNGLKKENEELQKKIGVIEEELNNLRKEKTALVLNNERLKKLEGENLRKDHEIIKLKEKVSRNNDLKSKVDEYESMKDELITLKGKFFSSELETNMLRESKEQVDALKTQLENKNKELVIELTKLKNQVKNFKGLEEHLEAEQQKCKELNSKLNLLESGKTIEKQIETSEENNNLEVNKELMETKEKLSSLQVEFNVLQHVNSELTRDFDKIKEEHLNLLTESEQLRKTNEQQQNDLEEFNYVPTDAQITNILQEECIPFILSPFASSEENYPVEKTNFNEMYRRRRESKVKHRRLKLKRLSRKNHMEKTPKIDFLALLKELQKSNISFTISNETNLNSLSLEALQNTLTYLPTKYSSALNYVNSEQNRRIKQNSVMPNLKSEPYSRSSSRISNYGEQIMENDNPMEAISESVVENNERELLEERKEVRNVENKECRVSKRKRKLCLKERLLKKCRGIRTQSPGTNFNAINNEEETVVKPKQRIARKAMNADTVSSEKVPQVEITPVCSESNENVEENKKMKRKSIDGPEISLENATIVTEEKECDKTENVSDVVKAKKRIARRRQSIAENVEPINVNNEKINGIDDNRAINHDEPLKISTTPKSFKRPVCSTRKSPRLQIKSPSSPSKTLTNPVEKIASPLKLLASPVKTRESPESPPQSPEPLSTCEDQSGLNSEPVLILLEKLPEHPVKKFTIPKMNELFDCLFNCAYSDDRVNCIVDEIYTQSPSYIAKFVFNIVTVDNGSAQKDEHDFAVLTTIQQILMGFMAKLEKKGCKIFDTFLTIVEASILHSKKVDGIESLSRLYAVICKLQDKIFRIRKFCCDVFFHCGDLAVAFFYSVLTSWPEILPYLIETNDDPVAKVLVRIVHLKNNRNPEYKLLTLKSYLKSYKKYASVEWNSEELFEEMFHRFLLNPCKETSVPLLLLSKNHEDKWIHSEINKNIRTIFEKTDSEPVKVSVIKLLGQLSVTFDSDTKDKYFEEYRTWLQSIANAEDCAESLKKCTERTLKSFSK